MTLVQPLHWGSIKNGTAEAAAVLLQNGKRHESLDYMFENISVACKVEASSSSELQSDPVEIRDAKDEVVKKLAGHVITWGRANVTKHWSAEVPGGMNGSMPGFVMLSHGHQLPWGDEGEKGEMGGIYTWEQKMRWRWEPGCYLLTFTATKKKA